MNSSNINAAGTSGSDQTTSSTPCVHKTNKTKAKRDHHADCDCSDDEIDEISEKRQSIFDASGGGPSGLSNSAKKTKLSNSSSIESSSFEDFAVKPSTNQSDDDWQFVDKIAPLKKVENADEKSTVSLTSMQNDANQSSHNPSIATAALSAGNEMCQSNIAGPSSCNGEARKLLLRRKSDSSLLSIKKSNSITIDTSSCNATYSNKENEVQKIKVSCNRCGKEKSRIKNEILKLSEQLKSSERSEDEINAKIKEFMDYLESRSQPSETEDLQQPLINNSSSNNNNSNNNTNNNESALPNSSSHDEIEENILDENEGIHVYPIDDFSPAPQQQSSSFTQPTLFTSQPSCSFSNAPKRFLSLGDINSR
jgi:hypothetical protein